MNRFKPVYIPKKKHGKGNPNWIGARFELTPELAELFQSLAKANKITRNMLVKQMVEYCLKQSWEKTK